MNKKLSLAEKTKQWRLKNPVKLKIQREKYKIKKRLDYSKNPEYFREKGRENYKNNREYCIKKSAERTKKRRQIFSELKKTFSCSKCGENNSACLDFHHKNSKNKDFEVGQKAHYSLLTIMKEISKCDVLCANCHRKLHFNYIEGLK